MEEEITLDSSPFPADIESKGSFLHALVCLLYGACILCAVFYLDEQLRERFLQAAFRLVTSQQAPGIPEFQIPRDDEYPLKDVAGSKPEYVFPPFKGIKRDKAYHSLIVKTSRQVGLDPALVKAIVMAESGFDSKAVSNKGAVGLMQLMPETAENLGVRDIFDAGQNLRAGARYFKSLLVQFKGNVKLALAAYNAGLNKVLEYGGVPPYEATRYYIRKVIHYYRFYKEQIHTHAGRF
jgi:soluble lytic murein transglycosylase-like protein